MQYNAFLYTCDDDTCTKEEQLDFCAHYLVDLVASACQPYKANEVKKTNAMWISNTFIATAIVAEYCKSESTLPSLP